MISWTIRPQCYRQAAEQSARESGEFCPTPWWFWIAAAVTAGAVVFQQQKRKRKGR